MTSQEDPASPQTIEECRQLIEQLEGQASLSPDSRSRLAETDSRLGDIFEKTDTPDALKEAVASCDEGIRLLHEINKRIWQVVNLKVLALWGKTRVCLDIGTAEYPEAVTDAADEGLNLVRDLRMVGRNYLLRPLRESLFRIAIEAYLTISYRFVPELILEHLDPENPGAAPESVRMHEGALEGLQRLREKARDNPDLMGEVYTTATKLATIRD